jgi:hypothetical protein
MSRPTLATTIAAGLLLSGLTPLLAGASPMVLVPCAAYTDPGENDATFNGSGQAYDANLDILSVTLGGAGTDVVARVKTKDLKDQPTDGADSFRVDLTVGGKIMQMFAYRDARGKTAKLSNFTDGRNGEAAVAFDPVADTVTITATAAQFDAALGGASAGQTGTAVRAESAVAVNGIAQTVFYDNATAPETFKYVVGAACGDDGGSGPVVDGFPLPGCNTVADVSGDAHAFIAAVPYDDDLDLRGLAMRLTSTQLKAFVRVEALDLKPANGVGHMFSIEFISDDTPIEIVTRAYDPAALGTPTKALADATASNVEYEPDTALIVNNNYIASGITTKFDIANSVVEFTLPRADIEGAVPTFEKGAEIKALTAHSATSVPGVGDFTADTTAPGNALAGEDKWTIGDNKCFLPEPAKMVNAGKTTVQYTDAAAVAAKLTEADGTPLPGRTVTFAIGTKRVTGRTGTDGIARASYNPGKTAGKYTLVATWAGDDTAGAFSLSVPFTVTLEKTVVTLTVTRSGTRRTVVAKLADDDKTLVTGQTITWLVNGKKVSSAKTTSKGTVTLTTAKPGQTVTASFAGVSLRYVKSAASKKV